MPVGQCGRLAYMKKSISASLSYLFEGKSEDCTKAIRSLCDDLLLISEDELREWSKNPDFSPDGAPVENGMKSLQTLVSARLVAISPEMEENIKKIFSISNTTLQGLWAKPCNIRPELLPAFVDVLRE